VNKRPPKAPTPAPTSEPDPAGAEFSFERG
jgi:hypothetical protein